MKHLEWQQQHEPDIFIDTVKYFYSLANGKRY